MDNILKEIAEEIINGSVSQVRVKVEDALQEGIEAKEILEKGLLVGMDEVGILFKDGEMFVPEVLIAAKAMQAGLELIKPMLLNAGVKSSAKILTATVEGDLHDIGVKLVGMMLEGAGFEVVNMGVDVPAEKIIQKIKEINPDIIGLSAMLTTTMFNMKNVIDLLKEEGLFSNIKIMVGGAPLSSLYAEKIDAYYASDANDAVNLAKKLIQKG